MASRTTSSSLVQGFALFGLGLLLGNAIVGFTTPAITPALLALRLAELDEDRDGYDTLFFGSSRIFRGVDPIAFDLETRRLGHETRSFNLAFIGMNPHETNALLRRVLSRPPAGLRHVVIELDDWTPEMHGRRAEKKNALDADPGRYTARALTWHDGPETRSVLRSLWLSDRSPRDKLDLFSTHVGHWGARALRVGDATRQARLQLGSQPDPTPEAASLGRRGFGPYVPEDYRRGYPAFFRKEFLAALGPYDEAVAGMRAANARPVSLRDYNLEALEAQIAVVRKAGAVPLYVLPPRGEATPRLLQLERDGHVPALIDFARPDSYPTLFEVGHRFDRQHLNPKGAAYWAPLLARRFADWQEGR